MPYVLLVLLLSTHAVHAQDVDNAVSITKKECEKIIRMRSFSGADYVAGVDAHGRSVTGADLNGDSPLKLPDEITFDIGVDLAERYGMPSGFYGKGSLGNIKVKGRNVYWNDQKLGAEENDAVLQACKAQYPQK